MNNYLLIHYEKSNHVLKTNLSKKIGFNVGTFTINQL